MNQEQFAAFLRLLMCSDPWPCDNENQRILKRMADDMSLFIGFTDWVDAYHKLNVGKQ